MIAAVPRHPAERGFTLAEVLVSLFLFGLVSAILLAVLNIENRADTAMHRQGDATQQVVTAQEILRGRIEAIRPEIAAFGTFDRIAIDGSSREFGFEAPVFASAGPHALHVFRVVLNDRHELVLRYASERSGVTVRDRAAQGWSTMKLLDRVQRLEFTYFGPDEVTGRDTWQQSWQERRVPPKLVRLRVGFAASDPRVWPVLLVRPWTGQRKQCDQGQTGPDCGVET